MPDFLSLPRELRDMIYIAIITYEAPKPGLGQVQPLFSFWKVLESESNRRGEYGCAYSYASRPSTCASFLVCNRQVYEEMSQAIERVERKGMLAAKLDCIAEDESFHYFTWLSIPVVKTSKNAAEGRSRIIPWWASRMVGRYLAAPQQALNGGSLAYRGFTTLIQRLWVDVRLVGDRSAKWLHNNSPPDRTSWAICAALKRILDNGPDFPPSRDSATEITVDELVLNVVTPPSYSPAAPTYLAEDFPTDGRGSGLVHPQTVARELVDVWNKIWSGDEFKGMFYHVLLERIKKVRVCVDGVTWRARELRLELERGQAERRRIAARVGW